MAVEKSDGKLLRELFVASEYQKREIKYLIKKEGENFLREYHLWFSVFNRPVQSSFTRLDRVTCCFVFYYLSMLLNILFYDGMKSRSKSDKELYQLVNC
jgi:polycystin 1L2